jgi:glycosyltransferase involved in cell wall biosynthesis
MSGRRRLVAVSAVAPTPPRDGYALRVCHLLEELGREWSIALVSPAAEHPPAGVEHWRALPPAPGWAPIDGFAGDYGARLRAELRAAIDDWKPAALLVWPGAERAALDTPGRPPAVCDQIDCGALTHWRALRVARTVRERTALTLELARCARFERQMVRAFPATVAVSEDDARWLARLGGRPVHVVPNGVTAHPPAGAHDEAPVPTVAFTGVLGYPPNVAAALHLVHAIWPRVRARCPDAQLVLAGRAPTPEIRALAAQPGVAVQADVPDVTAVLRSAWLAVAPMRSGAGIKNKVLEAWAVGRPVVLSPLAAGGLELDAEAARWIAGDPAQSAERILELLGCERTRRRAGEHVHALARASHSWSGAARRLSLLIDRVS